MAVRHYRVLVERDQETDLRVTSVPALDFLSTYGSTRDEALAYTREAIIGWLEAAAKEGIPIPEESPEAELVDVEVAPA